MAVNIDNFLDEENEQRRINSPRTLEACLRSGVDPAELYPKDLEEFDQPRQLPAVTALMYDHYEERRTGNNPAQAYAVVRLTMGMPT